MHVHSSKEACSGKHTVTKQVGCSKLPLDDKATAYPKWGVLHSANAAQLGTQDRQACHRQMHTGCLIYTCSNANTYRQARPA